MRCTLLIKTFYILVTGCNVLPAVNGQCLVQDIPVTLTPNITVTPLTPYYGGSLTIYCRITVPIGEGQQSLQLSVFHGSESFGRQNLTMTDIFRIQHRIQQLNCSHTGDYLCVLTGGSCSRTSDIETIQFDRCQTSAKSPTFTTFHFPTTDISPTSLPSSRTTAESGQILNWWYFIVFGFAGLVLLIAVICITVVCLNKKRRRQSDHGDNTSDQSGKELYLKPRTDSKHQKVNEYHPGNIMVGITGEQGGGYVNVTPPTDIENPPKEYDDVYQQNEPHYGNTDTLRKHANTKSQQSATRVPQEIYENSDIPTDVNGDSVYDNVALDESVYDDVPV